MPTLAVRPWPKLRSSKTRSARSGDALLFATTCLALCGQACDGGRSPPSRTARPDGVALFDPFNDHILLRHSLAPAGTPIATHAGVTHAATGMLPIAGDFDADGDDSLSYYDARLRRFDLKYTNVMGPPDLVVHFTLPSDTTDTGWVTAFPLAGDFDGDGRDTIGLYDPTHQTVYLRNANTAGPADIVFSIATTAVIPLVGDFDGDGIDTVGAYDPAAHTFALRNANSATAEVQVIPLGDAASYPLVGDFDGDGRDTIGTYDELAKSFALYNTNTSATADITLPLGTEPFTMLALAGHWDDTPIEAPWGGFAWELDTPANMGIDATQLDAAFTSAEAIDGVLSMLVVRHGKLVRESYFRGMDGTIASCVKSASKSVLSALFGVAYDQGLFPNTEVSLATLLPDEPAFRDDPRKADIHLSHLLTMSAGLQWDELDLAAWNVFLAGNDWAGTVLEAPVESAPGTVFNYSTGLTHVGSTILTRLTGMPTRAFAEQTLFGPLGIRVMRWDTDPVGIFYGGAELWMVPRDMARFGELYLEHGTIGGTRIVSSVWVDATTRPQIAATDGTEYGGWWWIRDAAGHEVHYANGYGGQFIFLIPDLDAVIVFTSRWDVTADQSRTAADALFALLADAVVPAFQD